VCVLLPDAELTRSIGSSSIHCEGGNRGGGGCLDDGLGNQLVDEVVKGGLTVWSALGADGFIL